MIKKWSKRLISSFLALAMVLSLGSATAFAAENTDMNVKQQSVSRATSVVISEDGWKFTKQRDSDLRNSAGRFYATSGQSVSITMTGIHSNSSQGFTVQVCRIVNGTPQKTSGPIHVDANKSNTYTMTFGIYTTGTYIIRMERNNDGIYQYIDHVTITLAG